MSSTPGELPLCLLAVLAKVSREITPEKNTRQAEEE